MQVDERLDLFADSSPAADDLEPRLRSDLGPFAGVDEHHREPDAVVDVVAAAAPSPAVVVDAGRDARDVPGGRSMSCAARVRVARAVGEVAGAARHRDGVDDTGRRHSVNERRLLRT